jgi:hypothetical protein
MAKRFDKLEHLLNPLYDKTENDRREIEMKKHRELLNQSSSIFTATSMHQLLRIPQPSNLFPRGELE